MKRSRKRSIVERGKRQDLNRNPPLLLVCPFIHCYGGQYLAGELICILEQDPLTLQLIAEELEEAGFATLRLSEAAGSLVVIKENRPDLLVLDTSLETQEIGWTLLESVRSDRDLSAMPVIVCASDPSLIHTRSPLLRRPPETSVFLKPFNPEALLKMIRATLHPGQ